MEHVSSATVTRAEASEAARELNEKKHSWNPFKSASDAGKTLEQWRETKAHMSAQKKSHTHAKSHAKKSSR